MLFLTPVDFGLVELTCPITVVATAAANIGLDDVILRRRSALLPWARSSFWISLRLPEAAGITVAAV